jgi:hypothetical protein
LFIDEQGVQQLAELRSPQVIEIIQFVFCSSMNKHGVLSLINTHWGEITVKLREHGTNHLL